MHRVVDYVGNNKEILHIICERGLYRDKMKGRQDNTAKERFEMNGVRSLIVMA